MLQLIRAAQVPWCGGGEGGDQADVVSAMQVGAGWWGRWEALKA